ncbi:enoyl-CoA hydratase-related protein [Pseudogemmobacter faecipullorum]|uniref:Enoyl-CoA hydratase/isomerase family protein n=1 Tax=Pseudogemmobacter faecipullorum TaxID=2755041 RepID=A0ABS8CK30_9RHOB|nr:enoyl-CoA hydratase-related protein [Pseudogemmobacter faecipullorum]MCB5409726.1 enoyl-CoA hydratase/isomerase family protein [Pseudogemmobacter faecipullorum]
MAQAEGEALIRCSDAGPGGEVLLLQLDAAPLNALTHPMRLALSRALSAAAAAKRPVVLSGGARLFSAATLIDHGAQLSEGSPSLADLCLQIETHPAPVVAALAGRALGPGAELALAAHARILGPRARFAFPEAGLGLPPMAGASQRLPRLVGAGAALDMLISAHVVSAREALAIGLADQLSENDLHEDALAFALAMAGPRPVAARRDGFADGRAYVAALAAARSAQTQSPLLAPRRIIECLEAALLLPPENGYAMERSAWEDLAAGAESRALLAAARAERAAAQLPAELLVAEPQEVAVLGLYGTSPQLAALALLALGRGMSVVWSDPDPQAQGSSLAWLRERIAEGHDAGGLGPQERAEDLLRLQAPAAPEALTAAEIVVHARPGPMSTTLSRADPDQLQLVIGGAGAAHPGLVLAPSGRLAEMGPIRAARQQQIVTAARMLGRFGLAPVLTGGAVGLGRRVWSQGHQALIALVTLGVAPEAITAALSRYGAPAPDLPQLVLEGAAPRAMAESEILARWLGAMANEGYALADSGAALRPSDIDAILIQGYGFPRAQGGPMHQALERGALVLRADLTRWQHEDRIWAPHPILDHLVSEGRSAF